MKRAIRLQIADSCSISACVVCEDEILTLWGDITVVAQVKRSSAYHDLVNDYGEAVHVALLSTLRWSPFYSQ